MPLDHRPPPVLTRDVSASSPSEQSVPADGSSHPCTPSTSAAGTSVETVACECCECLVTYEEDVRLGTGAEWVQCGCNCWLPEECIDSVVYGDDSKERFCSYCVL